MESPEDYQQPVFLHDPHAPRTATGAETSEKATTSRTSSSLTSASSSFDFVDYMSSASDNQLGFVTPPVHPMAHSSGNAASIYNVAGIVGEPTAEASRLM